MQNVGKQGLDVFNMISSKESRLSNPKIVPQNSLTNMKTGAMIDFAVPPPLVMGPNCSNCDNMSKNLHYLENYLRSNTAKNACESCATCLSFVLFMKQKCVQLQDLAGTYAMEQNVMYSGAKELLPTKKHSPIRKTIPKVGSSTSKNLGEAKTSGPSQSRLAKPQSKSFLASASSKKFKKKTLSVSAKGVSSSLKKLPESASVTMSKTKSSLSKDSTLTKRKRKLKTRISTNPDRKKTKVVKIADV